jgi:hypothetical protein
MCQWTAPFIGDLGLCLRCHHGAGSHHSDGCHWYDYSKRLACSCTLDIRAYEESAQARMGG